MKSILLFALLALASNSLSQPDTKQQNEIRTVIDQLFEGMRSGDSSLVRSTFHSDVRLLSTTRYGGSYELDKTPLKDFITQVGTPHTEIWDERVSNVVIQIDDGLAQVWMDYTFYLGDVKLHSGVNAFQLVHSDGSWQIISLIDTRRMDN